MPRTYSTYDAKARFSELLRYVREGERIYITYHGERVAEIRPIEESKPSSIEERLEELRARGEVLDAANPSAALAPVMKRPGALARFLTERD